MKLLILDTQNGEHSTDLLILEEGSSKIRKLELGYVPEFHYDAVNHQVIIVDTQLNGADSSAAQTQFWLKVYSADNFDLIFQKETPIRPMYTGFPGRSTRVKSSSSGRYIYFLESGIHPTAMEIYRIFVHRYDRETDEIQTGKIIIDSCMIDFAQFGNNEDQLCFHLACEYPSTVAFGNFNSKNLDFLHLIKLSGRTYGPKETCGSWFSIDRKNLYCINGEGVIFNIDAQTKNAKILFNLNLKKENYIPLQQIYSNKGNIFVGVSTNLEERSLSLASQIWSISIKTGKVIKKLNLPFPIMNFITTPDNFMIISVSPYQKAIVYVEVKTGKVLGIRNDIGQTPAEVFLIP